MNCERLLSLRLAVIWEIYKDLLVQSVILILSVSPMHLFLDLVGKHRNCLTTLLKCISVAGEFGLCRPMKFCNLCILMNSSYEKLTNSWIMVLLCA